MQVKTTMKYHLTPVRTATLQNLQLTNTGQGVERWEPSYTVGGNINWCSPYGKQCGGFSEKLELP